MKAKEVRDLTAENRFTLLLGEELERHSELTNNAPSDFFASQRSFRRQPQKQEGRRQCAKKNHSYKRNHTIILGDSQVKYIKPENLTTNDYSSKCQINQWFEN